MPSRPSWSRGFRAFTGLSFNLNFQSRLKLHSEVVLPDDGFAAAIVPVNSAEHFATFAANDNLRKAVVAAERMDMGI